MHPHRKLQIKHQISDALQNPNEEQVVKDSIQNEAKLTRNYLSGNISGEAYEIGLESHCHAPQRVILQTKEEFSYALSLLKLSKQTYDETLAHERSHYNAAKKHGGVARYCITVYKTPQNGIWIIPSTQVGVGLNKMLNVRRRTWLKEVINSPKHLSTDDALMLLPTHDIITSSKEVV